MRIQHNIMAMSAYRNYTNNVAAMKKNLEKLSSGYKINRAGDDAAGLAISEKMRAQITGLQTAQKNAKDGISLVQTAEGALTEVHDMLNRMVELATQSANGTYDNTVDRAQMEKELNQLRSEIDRIADSSNFNGIKLLDGSMSESTKGVSELTFNKGSLTAAEYETVNDVATWATTTAATATTSKMVLHTDGAKAQQGELTIDLSALKLEGDGTNKAAIKLTVGGASVTIEGSATASVLTGSAIANKLANGYVLTVGTTGTAKFIKSASNVAVGDVVYKGSVGTGSKAGFVTFKAVAVAKKAVAASNFTGTVTASNGTEITVDTNGVASVPDGITTAQQGSLKFEVKASKAADKGTTNMSSKDLQGWQNLGVTESTNLQKAGANQFGNTAIDIDPSKLEHNMKITIGTGDKAVTKYIKLSATAAMDSNANAGNTIDLSAITGATAAKKAAYASAIANAFNDPAQTGGIVVGAAGSKVTLSEYVNGSTRVSAADTAVQDAMKTVDGFKTLVKFEKMGSATETKGNAKLSIDAAKVYDGTTLKVTNASGTAKEYKITADKAKASEAGYVYMGSDVATALKNALAADFGASNVAKATNSNTIEITFASLAGSIASATDTGIKAELLGKKGLTLQIGDTAEKFNKLTVQIDDCHVDALGIKDISIADQESAAQAVDAIKEAINKVSDVRGTLGATQNRLDHTINNLSVMTENIQDAESTIRDTDVADEMMAYTKNNILIQSAQAMLAQANQVPQGVLQLLQ